MQNPRDSSLQTARHSRSGQQTGPAASLSPEAGGWRKHQHPRSRSVPSPWQHAHVAPCHTKLLHDTWRNTTNSRAAASPPPPWAIQGHQRRLLSLKCTEKQSVGHHTSAGTTPPEALCKLTVSYTKRKAFQNMPFSAICCT